MSIFETDNKTKEMCEKFIEYITTQEVQKTLTNIALFSALNMHIYSDNFYKEWEKVLLNPLKTFSVFLETQVLKNNLQVTFEALSGSENAKTLVNNWF